MTDYPDYTSTINIIGQILAELTARMKYGASLIISGHIDITGIETKAFATISGKGATIGGYFYSASPTLQTNDSISEYIDSHLADELLLNFGSRYGVTNPHSAPLYAMEWSPALPEFCIGLSRGVTFESELKLTYRHRTGDAATIYYVIIYALI